LFPTDLIDDTVILFKDRPSTGTNAFGQNLEITADLDISGTQTFSSGIDYTITPSSNEVVYSSSTGEHLRLYQDGAQSKVDISYLEADAMKLLVNGQYRDVIATGPPSTLPRNLRLYDIYPTEDPNEKKGYVEVRWNWDDLEVNGITGTAITIEKTSFNNEAIEFMANDLSTYLPGKRVYFAASSTYYEIQSVVDDGSTYTITVDSDASGESSTSTQPMRIVDSDVEIYRLRFRSSSQQGREKKELEAADLTTDFVTEPYFVKKLELGRQWYVTIQAQNNSYLSPVVNMPAGSFDPNHDGTLTDEVSYGSPFTMELPQLSSSGTLDLTATSQGFNVTITGWDGGTNEERYHEYEILWSDTVTIDAGTFDTLPLPNGVEQRFSRTGTEEIFAGSPRVFSVAVRPVQNRQGVDTPIIQQVSSGGGGIVPENQLLYEGDFNLIPAKFRVGAIRERAYSTQGDTAQTEKVYTTVAYNVITDEFDFIDPNVLSGQQFVKAAQTAEGPAS